MAKKPALLQIFAKYPIAGNVKTRLHGLLTPEQAVNVYKGLVRQSIEKFDKLPKGFDIELWGDAPRTQIYYKNLLSQSARLKFAQQQGKELGERMSYALRHGLLNYHKVLIVGSDCPVLSCEHIIEVSRNMTARQLNLIAAEDGGYVLISAMNHHPDFFSQKDWGSNKVLEQTKRTANEIGWNLKIHGELWDVDTPTDYQRYVDYLRFAK